MRIKDAAKRSRTPLVVPAAEPSQFPHFLRRAFKVAGTRPYRPVFLSIPMNVLDAYTDDKIGPIIWIYSRVAPPPVDRIARELIEAEDPPDGGARGTFGGLA